MKKKIYILIIILLLTTGCTCRYDLTINDNTYEESIRISASTSEEKNNLNKKWEIPFDKNNYYLGDENIDSTYKNYTYKYAINNNNLTFTHNFSKSDYANSTAISVCYKTISLNNYNGSTIISTSNNVDCFETYPDLTSLVINITVDKEVTSNNADRVSGNTYTWNINRNNAKNKGINLTFVNDDGQKEETIPNNEKSIKKNDYTMYIFAGILLIIVLFVYFIFNNLKNNDNEMDD